MDDTEDWEDIPLTPGGRYFMGLGAFPLSIDRRYPDSRIARWRARIGAWLHSVAYWIEGWE